MKSLRTYILLFLTLLSGCAGSMQAPDLIALGAGKAAVYPAMQDLGRMASKPVEATQTQAIRSIINKPKG